MSRSMKKQIGECAIRRYGFITDPKSNRTWVIFHTKYSCFLTDIFVKTCNVEI